jgi:hypothetical protein
VIGRAPAAMRRSAWPVIVTVAVACAVAVLVWGLGRKGTPPAVRDPQGAWTAPGSRPLPDAQAGALVTHRSEQRPQNALANDYVPSDGQLRAFYAARNAAGEATVQWNPLFRLVTGRAGLTRPSTDDLIQWAAHKWGIPEDVIRAQLSLESNWRMGQLGDRTSVSTAAYRLYPRAAQIPGTHDVYESMGIAQVKWTPDGSVGAGTEPLRWLSTAFDLDVYAATLRYYYDGYCHWCVPGYAAGQAWGSVGAWYEPSPWGNGGAQMYVEAVRRELARRPWE